MPMSLPSYWEDRLEALEVLYAWIITMQVADIHLMWYSLALAWIVTGVLSLGIYPNEDSFALLARLA